MVHMKRAGNLSKPELTREMNLEHQHACTIHTPVVVGFQIPVPEITGVATPTSAPATATKAHNETHTSPMHAHQ
jgi:hypothetical protein